MNGGDDAVRAVLARQLGDALRHLAALLRVLDAQTVRLVWDADTRDAYQDAREFLEANG